MGGEDKPSWFQRNLRYAASQKSWLAKTALSLAVFIGVAVLMFRLTMRQVVVVDGRRSIHAKFSGDDFLKFHSGDHAPDTSQQGTLLRYITHHIGGPSYKWLNLTVDRYDYSDYKLSTFIDGLLQERREGFYVEAGAGDGETNARSLYFEKKRGWQGLLVEANPWSYYKLLFKRRKAFSINACVNPSNRAKKLRFRAAGLKGGLHAATDPRHLEALLDHPDFTDDVEVQCFPIQAVLRALGVDYIDYLALDLHGAELDVLKTIPMDEVNIDVVSLQYRVTRPDTMNVDADATAAYLTQIRQYFTSLEVYTEVGILPKKGSTPEQIDANGVEVIFIRTELMS